MDYKKLKWALKLKSYGFYFYDEEQSFNIEMHKKGIRVKWTESGEVSISPIQFNFIQTIIPEYYNLTNDYGMIDDFISMIRKFPEAFKKMEKIFKILLRENDIGDLEKLVKQEVWNFRFEEKTTAYFCITDLNVKYQNSYKNTGEFVINDDESLIHITSCDIENVNDFKEIMEILIWRLRQTGEDNIMYLANRICTRDRKWIEKHGM